MTLPFVKRLTVCAHLKAVHLLILLTSFAKVIDPYIFCYAFLKIPYMCLQQSYIPCRIRMAAVGSKPVIHHSDKKVRTCSGRKMITVCITVIFNDRLCRTKQELVKNKRFLSHNLNVTHHYREAGPTCYNTHLVK